MFRPYATLLVLFGLLFGGESLSHAKTFSLVNGISLTTQQQGRAFAGLAALLLGAALLTAPPTDSRPKRVFLALGTGLLSLLITAWVALSLVST